MYDEWFRTFGEPVRGTLRLICFPHAGGAASAFLPMSRALAPDIEVLAVQYPGRQDRFHETPVEDIGLLADHIARALRPRLDRPYALFGHSMGAIVAYETARRLEQRSPAGPRRLFLSGHGTPSAEPCAHGSLDRDEDVIAEMRGLGGTVGTVLRDPDLMALVLPSVRADYKALGKYSWTPGPRLACPITALLGDSDPVVTPEAAAAWSGYSAATTDVHVFPGGHFYLEEHTPQIAALIAATLGAASRA
ncbi:thioesterase II family protein [Streptomyces antarcticus]|uniref:thioesterase II family protein n=1 Tax=Streptomyces antarcticus TaxID=2996458 RepID=UPI00226E3548|nr:MULTISPECIES: alpha/beta fold hydrolase [unclassified Streptomyces]MCY0941375.1 alpha/beta fold hydrolase [Streptomyces sp. H34-AA3]MCZ4086065.1 alpha/beta fold hydrolase [Streptomyces sp. H34-S5]